MPASLQILLHGTPIGTLTLFPDEHSFLSFDKNYINNPDRSILSQSFINREGTLITQIQPRKVKLPPFFSNLLPEGHLRQYLAQQAGVKPEREFWLLTILGEDLPGAVSVKPLEESAIHEIEIIEQQAPASHDLLRFSLAGIQLKFSALTEPTGGLTIPTHGVGGNWIVKLPSQRFSKVPENEWSMLHLAGVSDIPVPEAKLVSLESIGRLPTIRAVHESQALAIQRFDRKPQGGAIHIEDFAQVYGVYPDSKYQHASYANIAKVTYELGGESQLIDFIRRLVFSIMIGNGDMHLKNWSLMYLDNNQITLTPAYDQVSTILYLPDDQLALTLGKTKIMQEVSLAHFLKLAEQAELPNKLVQNTVQESVAIIWENWKKNSTDYPLTKQMINHLTQHMQSLALY